MAKERHVVSVIFTPEELRVVRRMAKFERRNLSQFINNAVFQYVSAKK